MSHTPRTIKRRPVEGDLIVALDSGVVYRVEELCRDGYDRVMTLGVVDLATGLPNAFSPSEVATVSARDAARLGGNV